MKNYYENSKQIESEGELVNGKKEGEWKWYYPNGQLKKQGVYKEDVANGHFYFYHENGQESANGIYKDGEREGDWIWHFENKKLNQHGSYKGGKLHGKYTWYDKAGNVKQTTEFRTGKKHGLEQIMHKPGSGVVSVHVEYKDGLRHGKYERRNDKDEVVESATYYEDFFDGEHILQEEGKKRATKKKYDKGVPILTEKRWNSLASQIDKKKDSYQKMKVAEKVADWGARARTIWYMLLEGYLQLENHLDLLYEIKGDSGLLTVDKWISLLKALKLNKKSIKNINKFLPFWPLALDEVCMKTYANAEFKKAYASNLADFSANVKEGIRLVQIRYGDADKSVLTKDLAQQLAEQHILNYGIGLQGAGVDGAFSKVWWLEDGQLAEVNISDPSRGGLPGERFYEFIELFTTRDAWEQAALQVALNKEYNVPMPNAMDAVRIASVEEFAQLLKAMDTSAFHDYYWALAELRNDSAEELEQVAKALKEDWRPGQEAEATIIVAILRHKEAGTAVPDWYDEYITFDSYYSRKSNDGRYFVGLKYVEEALNYLDKERRQKLIQHQLEHEYAWDRVFPLLHLLEDTAIWDQAILAMTEKLKDNMTLSNLAPIYRGLARMGETSLPWQAAKIDSTSNEPIQQLLSFALICTLSKLAKEDKEWSEQYDQYFDVHAWPPKYGDDFDHYVQPFWAEAFKALPPERQEQILLPQIDPAQKTFMRVFSLLDDKTPQSLLFAAFDALGKGKIKRPGNNWLDAALRESLKEKASELVKRALKAGAKGEVLDWLRNGFGYDKFEQLKKDLEKETGQKVAKKLTKLEQLQELLEERYAQYPEEERTVVYWLERDKKTKLSDKVICRVGGAPVGVDADNYPLYEKEPMGHVLTLDLRQVPEFTSSLSEDIVAVSLFVANPDYNEAYTAGNNQVKLVYLTEEDLKKGTLNDSNFKPYTKGYVLKTEQLKVPKKVFLASYDDLEKDEDLQEIKNKLYNAPGYALGLPIWLQGDEYFGKFILQFDEKLANINLGDSGIMYMFADTAFWQCY